MEYRIRKAHASPTTKWLKVGGGGLDLPESSGVNRGRKKKGLLSVEGRTHRFKNYNGATQTTHLVLLGGGKQNYFPLT